MNSTDYHYSPIMNVETGSKPVAVYCPAIHCAYRAPCPHHDDCFYKAIPRDDDPCRTLLWYAEQFRRSTNETVIQINKALMMPPVMLPVMLPVIINYLGLGMFSMDRLADYIMSKLIFSQLCVYRDGRSYVMQLIPVTASSCHEMCIFISSQSTQLQEVIRRFRVPEDKLWLWISEGERSSLPIPRDPYRPVPLELDEKVISDICGEALETLRAKIEWRDVVLSDIAESSSCDLSAHNTPNK